MSTSKMEFKTFSLKLDGPPDAEGRFTGYAAVFGNVDKGNDVIEPGAFTKTLQETPTVPILWSHNPDEPIGISTSMVEDGRGLKVEGQFAMEVQRAREVHALMVLGAVKGLSIGYRVYKKSYSGSIRHLHELGLGEFSPTVFPMNDMATVTGAKHARLADEVAWYATQGVSALIEMVGYGSRLMVGRAAGGDVAGATRLQVILESLAGELLAEVTAVGEGAIDASPEELYTEAMSEPVKLAIKRLEALLNSEPAPATHEEEVAAPDAKSVTDEEPAIATLAALTRALRAGS
jgi:HK97 family phage prohead protease